MYLGIIAASIPTLKQLFSNRGLLSTSKGESYALQSGAQRRPGPIGYPVQGGYARHPSNPSVKTDDCTASDAPVLEGLEGIRKTTRVAIHHGHYERDPEAQLPGRDESGFVHAIG
jgi:hypothetical protein